LKNRHSYNIFDILSMMITAGIVLFILFTLLSIIIGGLPYLKEALRSREVWFSIGLSIYTASISTSICVLLAIVMAKLGLVEHTVHCRTEEPENCAQEILKIVKKDYRDKKIALIGYQPSILEALSKDYKIRVLDLNPKNVGQIRYGIEVEHGIDDYKEAVLDWADVVLCTGSTLCNGTIVHYFNIGKEVIFFGITVAGAAKLLGLNRLCPCSG